MSKKRYWRIVGYDGTKTLFQTEVPLGFFTDKQMSAVLRVLVARAGLTEEEILDSHAKRNTKRYRGLLEVQVQAKPIFCLMCGTNPHFVASVIEK